MKRRRDYLPHIAGFACTSFICSYSFKYVIKLPIWLSMEFSNSCQSGFISEQPVYSSLQGSVSHTFSGETGNRGVSAVLN